MPKTYLTKVCATCGKAEGKNWARHWKLRHPTEVINELVPGEAPSHPYDENWVYLIKDPKVKELFRISFKEVHQQDALSEEVAETIEEPRMDNDNRVGSQVLPPIEVAKTTIEEAANLFDSKPRYQNHYNKTIEINVESDSDLSNEDTKI
jgi:hypothetical protein